MRSFALTMLLLLAGTTPALSEWAGPSGTPIASTFHGFPVAVVADGAGGALVAYQGLPVPGGPAIRIQHVTAGGDITPGWPADGAVACSLATTPILGRLRAVSDGAGGAYLVWLEAPEFLSKSGTAYVQRVLADGTRAAGWPARGRLLANGAGQSYLGALADGLGGVLAAWLDFRGGTTSVRGVRVRADGTNAPGFPINGLVYSQPVDGANFARPVVRPDGSTGFWVAFSIVSNDTTLTLSTHQLLHLSALGGVDPDWFGDGNGFTLPGLASAQIRAGTAPLADGSGGAYLLAAIEDEARLYHVLADRSPDPAFPPAGVSLGSARPDGFDDDSFQLADDGSGGLYATWPTLASLPIASLAFRRLSADGAFDPAWPEPQYVTADYEPTLLVDAAGMFVCGTSFFDCPHQNCVGFSGIWRRASDGSLPVGWPLSTNPFFTTGGYGLPAADSALGGPVHMARDGSGGVIAAWTRDAGLPPQPYGGPATVRVMRFVAHGPVASVPLPASGRLGLHGVRFARGIVATLAWSGAGDGSLEAFDVLGRRVGATTFAPSAGWQDMQLPGTETIGPGLYFLRARAGGELARARAVVVR
jgi:hypothetical protein